MSGNYCCKNCAERCIGCHGGCKRYKAFCEKKQIDKEKEKQIKKCSNDWFGVILTKSKSHMPSYL